MDISGTYRYKRGLMYDNKSELLKIVKKYLQGKASPEEKLFLEAYYDFFDSAEKIIDQLLADELELLESAMEQEIFNRIELADQKKTLTLWPTLLKISAAASILIALSVGGHLLLHQQQPTETLVKNDIEPGHNQATLILANGKKIILTRGLNGLLARQGKTQIHVHQNNIIYDAKNKTGDQISYNTLSTAKGEQSPYPLILTDGTKVWLNAESSITFPTAFNQKERIVKITGEALFEVAHDPKQPFKVEAANQTIEDIGTQFDVNAYIDEPATKTTLIEGSVKVNNIIIKPGQQTDGSHIKTVNTEIVTAWKEGNFHFEGDDIQTVMRQLTRWYNIDVTYQGQITHEVFYADISRNRNISAVLKLLEKTNGVQFKIEGRRVAVIP